MKKSKEREEDGAAGHQLDLWSAVGPTSRMTVRAFSRSRSWICLTFPESRRTVFFCSGVEQLEALVKSGVERTDIFTARELQNLKWVMGAAPFTAMTLWDATELVRGG